MLRFALLGLALLAPSAAAQGFDLVVEDVAEPVRPLAGPVETRAVVTVPCETVGNATGARVSFSFEDVPPWASLVAVPVAVPVAPCHGSTDVDASVLVNVTERAPALAPWTARVVAVLEGGERDASDSEPLRFEAAYFGILDAHAETTIAQAPPQKEIRFPITVANLGNGGTKVFFEVANAPDGWQVVAPLPIVLESPTEGGNVTRAVVNLNVLTPYRNGHLNEVGAITLKISSAHALRPELKGDEAAISVLATVKGWYVPGPATFAALAALAGAAVALRRR